MLLDAALSGGQDLRRSHAEARNLTRDGRLSETVTRIRQRLDTVFEDAMFHKRCTSNPAAGIKRKLREAQPRREKGALKALPFAEAPTFAAATRKQDGVAARCLEFALLTAARTKEAVTAEWAESSEPDPNSSCRSVRFGV